MLGADRRGHYLVVAWEAMPRVVVGVTDEGGTRE